jgi:hypothetical protein
MSTTTPEPTVPSPATAPTSTDVRRAKRVSGSSAARRSAGWTAPLRPLTISPTGETSRRHQPTGGLQTIRDLTTRPDAPR